MVTNVVLRKKLMFLSLSRLLRICSLPSQGPRFAPKYLCHLRQVDGHVLAGRGNRSGQGDARQRPVELAAEATGHVDTPRALRTCKTIRTRTNRTIPARTSQRRNVGQVTAWPPRTVAGPDAGETTLGFLATEAGGEGESVGEFGDGGGERGLET